LKNSWIFLFIALPYFLNAQFLSTKGQLWIGGLKGNNAPTNQSSLEMSIGYIPTASFYKDMNNDMLFDAELAYKAEQYYSGDLLLLDNFEPHRVWMRFSSQRMEARIGLQKITFGPAQMLRSLSWFDSFDLKDPTGQTDGVDAFRFQWFPSNSFSVWSWIVRNEQRAVSFGWRGELSSHMGEWGITVHHDPTDTLQMIGQTGAWFDQRHNRVALDFRYDGLMGFWNENALIFSKGKNITLATIGADYTLPVASGILIMTESMLINSSQKNSDRVYTAFMASVPLGMIHQIMFITQLDWEEEKIYNYLRWSATYDRYSLNFIASISPKRSAYKAKDYLLSKTAAGFGTNFQLMFIYNY